MISLEIASHNENKRDVKSRGAWGSWGLWHGCGGVKVRVFQGGVIIGRGEVNYGWA